MAKKICCINIIITLDGIEKIKTSKEKKRQEDSLKNTSFSNAVGRRNKFCNGF